MVPRPHNSIKEKTMIDLRDIAKMVPVSMDRPMVLGATESRTIRLEVNTGEPAQFWLSKYGDTNPETHQFLGVIMGRESVLFPAHGPVAIFADCDGPCFAWAAEIEQTWVEVEEASFVKPHKRNKMTPELTAMAEMLNAALDRRAGMMEADIRADLTQQFAARSVARVANPAPRPADTGSAASPDEANPIVDEGNGGGGDGGTGGDGTSVATKKPGKKTDE